MNTVCLGYAFLYFVNKTVIFQYIGIKYEEDNSFCVSNDDILLKRLSISPLFLFCSNKNNFFLTQISTLFSAILRNLQKYLRRNLHIWLFLIKTSFQKKTNTIHQIVDISVRVCLAIYLFVHQ